MVATKYRPSLNGILCRDRGSAGLQNEMVRLMVGSRRFLRALSDLVSSMFFDFGEPVLEAVNDSSAICNRSQRANLMVSPIQGLSQKTRISAPRDFASSTDS